MVGHAGSVAALGWRTDVRNDDDEPREAPPAVVSAVAFGTAPLPFLAVYTVMFIVHGGLHPVVPPDITHSAHGELLAGFICLVLFVVSVIALLWMLSGRRRWPFAIVQLAVLGTAIDFAIDNTKGGRPISVILIATSIVSLVSAFLPPSWEYVGRSVPRRRKRPAMPLGSGAGPDTTPDSARLVGRRDDTDISAR
jgi:hypothetical protein